jgi:hypothetical protein
MAEVRHPRGKKAVAFSDHPFAPDSSVSPGDLPNPLLGALKTRRGDARIAFPDFVY